MHRRHSLSKKTAHATSSTPCAGLGNIVELSPLTWTACRALPRWGCPVCDGMRQGICSSRIIFNKSCPYSLLESSCCLYGGWWLVCQAGCVWACVGFLACVGVMWVAVCLPSSMSVCPSVLLVNTGLCVCVPGWICVYLCVSVSVCRCVHFCAYRCLCVCILVCVCVCPLSP